MKTLLKIEQGFESQTFQLNFDSLKSFKMLEIWRKSGMIVADLPNYLVSLA